MDVDTGLEADLSTMPLLAAAAETAVYEHDAKLLFAPKPASHASINSRDETESELGVISSQVVTPERHASARLSSSRPLRTPLGALTNRTHLAGTPPGSKGATPARHDAALAVPVPVAFRSLKDTTRSWQQGELVVQSGHVLLQPRSAQPARAVKLPLVDGLGNGLVISAVVPEDIAQRLRLAPAEQARALLIQQQVYNGSAAVEPGDDAAFSSALALTPGWVLLMDCEAVKQATVAELVVGAAGSQLTRWKPRSLGPLPCGTRVVAAAPLPGTGDRLLLACNTGLCVTRLAFAEELGGDDRVKVSGAVGSSAVPLPLILADGAPPLDVAQLVIVPEADAVLLLGGGQLHLVSLSALSRAAQQALSVQSAPAPVHVHTLPDTAGAQKFAAGMTRGQLFVLSSHGTHMMLLTVAAGAEGAPQVNVVKKAKGEQCRGDFACLAFLPAMGKFAWGTSYFSTLEPVTLDVEPFLLQRDPQWAVHLQLEQVQSVFPIQALQAGPDCYALCYNEYALLVTAAGEPVDPERFCVRWAGKDPQDFVIVGHHLVAFSRGCAEVHDLTAGEHYTLPLHRAAALCAMDGALLLSARAPGGDAQMLLLQQPTSRPQAAAHWATPRPRVEARAMDAPWSVVPIALGMSF